MLQLMSFPPGMPGNPLATWAVGKNVPEPPLIEAPEAPEAPEPGEGATGQEESATGAPDGLGDQGPPEGDQTPPEKATAKAKRRRAHDPDGQFTADNPATPEVNEAWEAGNAEA